MTRYVALLRGINVGGHKKVSMAELRGLLAALGHTDVSTYIQSGNALFTSDRDDSARIAAEIEGGILREMGFAVPVMLRTGDELAAAVTANPFPEATVNPGQLHLSFLSAAPNMERLEEIDPEQFAPDEFRLGDRVLYLLLPNGMRDSKLAAYPWERRLGVGITTRNWNTVTKLLHLVNG